MQILLFAVRHGFARRCDKDITVIHPNHEPFRLNYKTNIVLDRSKNLGFSEMRAKSAKTKAISVNLALLPPSLQRSPIVEAVVTRFDLVVNRMRNIFQYASSSLSLKLVMVYQGWGLHFRALDVFGVMVPIPCGMRKGAEDTYGCLVRERLDELVGRIRDA